MVAAGRDPAAVGSVGAKHGAQSRSFGLDDPTMIDGALDDIALILNCAGPFLRTAEPLLRAALRRGIPYLDIAAELDSYRLAAALDDEAKARGVMLLPGCGGSVAMLGSLAGHAAARVAEPRAVAIALHVAGGMSRGSAQSARENVSTETLRSSGGKLMARSAAETRYFELGRGEVECFPVTLPDLLTIQRSAGILDIETFVHVSGAGFPTGDVATFPDGPTAAEREANRYQAVAEVTGADGTVVRSLLDTVNGYTFTALAAVEAARRVLAGERRAGFQTPAGLFGHGFAATIADTRIVDL